MSRIGVVGAGAWGTALAVLAARRGDSVQMWTRRAELAVAVEAARQNSAYLPGVVLDPAIRISAKAADLNDANPILVVTPAQHVRAILAELEPAIAADAVAVICSKGIELASGKLLSTVVSEVLPGRPLAVMTGPSFADEVARNRPTAVTVACDNPSIGVALVETLGT